MSRQDGSPSATFNAGTTSTTIALNGAVPYALALPASGWVAGNITFLVSVDGTNFYPLYVADGGTEALYTITSASTGGRIYYIDGSKFYGCAAMQVVAASQTNTIKVGLRDFA